MKIKLPDGISWLTHGLFWCIWMGFFAVYMFGIVADYSSKGADYTFLCFIQISSFYLTAFILLPSAYHKDRFSKKRLIGYLCGEIVGILFLIFFISWLVNSMKINLDADKPNHLFNFLEVVFLLYTGIIFAFVYVDRNGKEELIELQELELGAKSRDLKNAQAVIHDIQEQLSENELKNLNNSLIPHLMNNLLNVLGYVLANSPLEAPYVYAIISQLVQFYAKLRLHELIPLRDELNMAREYIKLQSYKWKGPIHIVFDVSPGVLDFLVIPMQVLLLVENICKYGVVNREGQPSVIRIFESGGRLVIHAENDINIFEKPVSESTKKGLESLQQSMELHGKNFELKRAQTEEHFIFHLEYDV